MKWIRVTRGNPCPICRKPDWCCVGEKFVNCMRVQSPKECDNGGWLHPLDARPSVLPVKHEAPRPTINATQMMRDWRVHTSASQIKTCACSLGVHPDALEALAVAWASPHRAWAFPMKDGYGNIIGIRLRNDTGRKWAVTGSRAGLIYGRVQPGEACLCEGPTDTAAALTLGLNAIGRPSCRGSEDDILITLKPCRRVLIIVDNDDPGWDGATHLQVRLKIPSVCWSPPTKDLREFLRAGGTPALLRSLTSSLIWTKPKEHHDRVHPQSLQSQRSGFRFA